MKYDPLCPTIFEQDELINVVFAFYDFDNLSNSACKWVLNAGYEGKCEVVKKALINVLKN